MKNAGFVSERQAVGVAEDGHITGSPTTANDIKLAYRVFGSLNNLLRKEWCTGILVSPCRYYQLLELIAVYCVKIFSF